MNADNNTDWSKQTTVHLVQLHTTLDRTLYEKWESAQEKAKAHSDYYMIGIELHKRRAL
jgi:hypothetical protein